MKLKFATNAWADYTHWQDTDKKILARINVLIEECRRHPSSGIGKPEALKGNLAGWWSRRIDREHRQVYRVSGSGDAQTLEIAQCRYHF